MKRYYSLFLMLLVTVATSLGAPKSYTVTSPNKTLSMTVSVGDNLSYTLAVAGDQVVTPSTISMTLADGRILGRSCKVSSAKQKSNKEIIPTPLYRQDQINVEYNELELQFKGDYSVIFRLYNDGAAYRFVTRFADNFIVVNEQSDFNFNKDYKSCIAYSSTFCNSFQNTYSNVPISGFDDTKMAMTPLVVELDNGAKLTLAESDLEAYPGMFLKRNGVGFSSIFAQVPDKMVINEVRCQQMVETRTDYIASCQGNRNFPWRVYCYTENDTQMPSHNLVYALAAPNRIGSTDWIKPGKVAWDWWNDWGLIGVDFEAGVNTDTYLYYIDFAGRNGIEYVVLDEGWYDPKKGDMMTVIDDVDLEKLVARGKEVGVKLILWGVGYSFDNNIENICKKYSQMGIAGFKIDFFNRDDQKEVERVYRIAEVTAKYKMLIDYHGIYKPTGLNRTYPNAINFEGVFGLEEMKWSTRDMTQYDVTMPYIRMMAGPVDYTQGAMRNANKENFRANYYVPMSQGTRSHQVATYVVFDSPLVMLCDAPTTYEKEQQSVDFITSIPTVWDETRILQGVMGEYIVTARRSGNDWYIGGLTNWTTRDLELNLSLLGDGNYNATIMQDGKNSDQHGEDYVHLTKMVDKNSKLNFHLAPGGGFAIILKK